MNLLDEEELLDLYSRCYRISGFLKLPALFFPISLSPMRKIFELTRILQTLTRHRSAGLLGVDSNWLSLNRVEFQLGTTPEWCLVCQDQILNLFENQELPRQDSG